MCRNLKVSITSFDVNYGIVQIWSDLNPSGILAIDSAIAMGVNLRSPSAFQFSRRWTKNGGIISARLLYTADIGNVSISMEHYCLGQAGFSKADPVGKWEVNGEGREIAGLEKSGGIVILTVMHGSTERIALLHFKNFAYFKQIYLFMLWYNIWFAFISIFCSKCTDRYTMTSNNYSMEHTSHARDLGSNPVWSRPPSLKSLRPQCQPPSAISHFLWSVS